MVSNRERESRWPTAGLLLLSLLLHAGLLLMPLPNAVSPAPHEASPVIAVRLFAPPAGAGLDEIAEPDDATQREELTETAADSAEALTSSIETETDGETEADTAAAPSSAHPARQPFPAQLRAQLLDSARSQGEAAEKPAVKAANVLEGAGLPRLPSGLGWMNQYTGTVEPRDDHRQNADGSSDSRVVTRSGAIYCIHRRAPSVSEFFNPWTSTAVGMIRGCGRARPEPLDSSDPWLRQPGEG